MIANYKFKHSKIQNKFHQNEKQSIIQKLKTIHSQVKKLFRKSKTSIMRSNLKMKAESTTRTIQLWMAFEKYAAGSSVWMEYQENEKPNF